MKTWWYSLTTRERNSFLLGIIIISMALVWFYGLKPFLNHKRSLVESVSNLKTDQAFLIQVANEIPASSAPEISINTANQPLQRLVEPVLQRYKLDNPSILTELRDTRSGAVNMTLRNAPFDEIARMLGSMELIHQAKASQLSITPSDTTGLVNARITLKR